MADFFNKIEGATKNVMGKGKDLTEIFQIEREIGVYEKEINQLKILIGDYVVRKGLLQEDAHICAYAENIKMKEESIAIKKQNIMRLKNIKKCPGCDAELPMDARFCKSCGEKIEESKNNAAVSGKVCMRCGAVLAEAAIFCSNCGNKAGGV